ncbi:HAD hydrolase-like protein [Arthrobacter ginkgonis]|uniref:HAD hydrolase-like protein n=1 Tax=Arthrobacter ginkgonis TaxID=1630594 RepID=A0ABP7C9V8_9MICC
MLISGFDAVLSDLDGVVYAGAGAIEGAVGSLDRLASAGVSLAYITNNASRSPDAVAAHLRDLGAPASAEQVFGSADAGAELLAGLVEPGASVLVVGSAYLREQVVRHGLSPVASAAEHPAAVIQGFDPAVSWTDLAQASYAVSAGAVWVATNTDLTIPRAEGMAPGNGSLVAAVAAASKAVPHVAGKPEPLLFRRAATRLGAARPLVVGDRLDTDIRGGNAAGYSTAAVLTGVDTPESILAARRDERPDFLIADLTELYLPYPEVRGDGAGFTCGEARAQVDGDTLTVAGESTDLNAWRAACAAWWLAHPHAETARLPQVDFVGA